MIGDIMNVVISDLHIGHLDSTFSLSNAEDIFKHFVQEIKEIDSVEKLILLGDVFDFWIKDLPNILKRWSLFLKEVGKITDEFIYVPGNHDHHFLVLCKEMENIRKLEDGAIPDYSFRDLLNYEYPKRGSNSIGMKLLRGVLPSLQDIHIQLFYPEYTCEWKKKKIVFRHGHYLDSGLFRLMPWLFELFGGKIKSEKDFEIVNTPIYEHFYWVGDIEEIRMFYQILHWIYKKVELRYKRNKHKDLETRKKDIERFFATFKHDRPDIFILGHTHVADRKILDNMEVLNSGCWVRESGINHFDTYLTIGDDLKIRKVGGGVIFDSSSKI
jgi:UDP-2,3-diacylglucosamine pyrophosphatase LpxH